MTTSSCLANTGFDLLPLLFGALLLMGLGLAAWRIARLRSALLVLALVAAGFALAGGSGHPAGAACAAAPVASTTTTTTTTAPPAAATPLALAAGYLVSQLAPDHIEGLGGPDYGDTSQAVIALVASGQTSATVSQAIASATSYLHGNIDAYVDGSNPASASNDDATALAELLLVAHATSSTGIFTSADVSTLVARLVATQSTGSETGLYGSQDPTYDGSYRQSLALEALVASGVPTADSGVQAGLTWLLGQQCSGLGAGIDGGFSSDAANNPCSGSPSSYQGPDTNSTGAALVALAAMGQSGSSTVTQALGYLSATELAGAGWDFFGGGLDSNSTSIVIVGLRAVGQDPSATSGTWARTVSGQPSSPAMALAEFQQLAAGSGQGGFFFQAGSPPDIISSVEGTTSLAGATLPI